MPETTAAEEPEIVPPDRPPVPARRPRAAIAALTALGLAAVLGAAGAIGWSVQRSPSAEEKEAAGEREVATRWSGLPAGEIFPARLEGAEEALKPTGLSTGVWSADRVGIAPPASCRDGFDARLAAVMAAHGCRSVLRATYTDPSRTQLVTLGIAVLPSADEATRTEGHISSAIGVHAAKESVGVRAAAFPGTVAAGFTDAHRHRFWVYNNQTPYLFFATGGWTVDRGGGPEERAALAIQLSTVRAVLHGLVSRLEPGKAPCERKRVQC
ncbi:hypothetical protein ACIBF1_17800 [Spirillospora sp. NPDC050679]